MNREELKQRLVELVMAARAPLTSRPIAEKIADFLIENDVTIRERGEWKFNKDGSGTCNRCGRTQGNVWDFDNYQNFCFHFGADMRGVKDE